MHAIDDVHHNCNVGGRGCDVRDPKHCPWTEDDRPYCVDPECRYLFPHTADESCGPSPFTSLADALIDAGLNADDDPSLL